jgi:[NiFe] hydrogenase assembly HybE family chaperone
MDAVKEKLEAVFNDIAQTRMVGVPICNPELHVQVAGLREWQGRWLGVLVTPWTISLVLMPGEDTPLPALAAEEKMAWEFPSGKYQFMALGEAALGACQTCSLLSPVIDIHTQADAIQIAEQVMEALFIPQMAAPRTATIDEMLEMPQPMPKVISNEPLSRRAFLRGGFLGT